LGITLLSILGLAVISVVVNTLVRGVTYDAHDLATIVVVLALVMVVMLVLTAVFALHVTKRMEESRAARENQENSRMAEQRFKSILDSSPLACCVTDYESNVLDCNTAAVELFGLKDKQEFCDRFFELSPERQPDGTLSQTKLQEILRQTFETKRVKFEWMHQTLGGEPIPCEVILERMVFEGKTIKVGYLSDLRDFHKYRETERIAQQRLQAMLDSSPLACSIFDENFDVLEVNQEMLKLFDLADKREYLGRYFDFSPKYQPDGQLSREKMMEKARLSIRTGRAHFEWMYRTPDGKSIPCEMTVVRMAIDGKDLLIGYARDLREINAAAFMVKQLEKLAFTDTLTGARNRRFFAETAERELHSCIDEGREFSLILLDIDHFKLVNDTYGHGIGDEVLKIIVRRTRHSLKYDTLVARYGGEEFMVMLPGVGHGNAMKIAWQIQRKIEETPFSAEDLEIAVTVSLGVASRTAGCAALQDIIKHADKALYHAKNTGRNKAVSYGDIPTSY